MKLSIITINRNNAEGLRKTIESVIQQTYTDFEYIIIDGASTDGSVAVVKEFANKITYWISEPDKGIYNAMNKGVLKANGEYLLFLNSGDWLVDEILNEIFAFNFNEDILYGNCILDFIDGSVEIEKRCAKDKLTFWDFFNSTLNHQATFIKKSIFDKTGLYNESYKIVSDVLYFINAIIYYEASYKYIDIEISHFDPYGIGNNGEKERTEMLQNLLPKLILDDYVTLNILYKDNQALNFELNRYKHRFERLDKLITFSKKSIKKLYQK